MNFFFRMIDGPIQGDWASQQVCGPDAGCLIEFRGTVRDSARGQAVLRLEYEAYPAMVEAELRSIAEEVMQNHDVLRIAVEHSTGTVLVGKTSVTLAVASAHRAAAFLAASDFMDALKQRVPIWKKECYSDGSVWKGQGS